jgi:hypothetical protein
MNRDGLVEELETVMARLQLVYSNIVRVVTYIYGIRNVPVSLIKKRIECKGTKSNLVSKVIRFKFTLQSAIY